MDGENRAIKIVSGGQTGAGQAALDAAIEMGIPYGGWISKGRMTEAGPLSEKYKLTEMPTGSYLKRTKQNIFDSDGTVVFSRRGLKGSPKRTVDFAIELKRPSLHIDLAKHTPEEAAGILTTWIEMHNISVLNVAGTRASKDPKIYQTVSLVVAFAINKMNWQNQRKKMDY